MARPGCRWDGGCSALTDWTRDGTLAEYVAVEARNLAPLPGDVDFTVGASLPISPISIPDAIKVGRTVFADLMKEPVKMPTPIDRAELQRLLRDEQAQLVEVLLEAARRFADIEPE